MELLTEELADAEDSEESLAENVFWVLKEARWSHLQAKARQPTIGNIGVFEIVSTNIHESRTLAQASDLLLPKLMSREIRLAKAKKAMDAVA